MVIELSNSRTELKLPSRRSTRDVAKEALNHVHLRTGGRGEIHVEAFVLLKPSLHFRVFVRGVIVHDQMQLKMLGRFAIDLFEKFQPLLMPVLSKGAVNPSTHPR